METLMPEYVKGIPKCELHLHLEGTLEAELLFKLSHKNGISIPYKSIKEVADAYNFKNLQSFLDLYFKGASVLIEEEDFYDLTMEYFQKAHDDNVKHTEMMFDPQLHTERGISIEHCLIGIHKAQTEANKKWHITSKLIPCFLRHLPMSKHWETLEALKPYLKFIDAVGVSSTEKDNPNYLFKEIMEAARKLGLRVVSHAGEEGPASNIKDAVTEVLSERIDHGVTCTQDIGLVKLLIEKKIPLTVCPISNVKLQVVGSVSKHPLLKISPAAEEAQPLENCFVSNDEKPQITDLIPNGLKVCINSDDPSYFGGYITDNFLACVDADSQLNWTTETVKTVVINSIEASFLSDEGKLALIDEVNEYDKAFRNSHGL